MIKMKNKNICLVCDKHIDKSDAQHAWVTITRSSFFLEVNGETKRTPSKRAIMHLECAPNQVLESMYKSHMNKEIVYIMGDGKDEMQKM
jgi:hypothetical protein